MHIKILGTGCRTCQHTEALIRECVAASGSNAEVEKVEAIEEILRYGVMATPAVVIDEKVVHAGGTPKRRTVMRWLGVE
jgi:small redox-active disulfide protein 2